MTYFKYSPPLRDDIYPGKDETMVNESIERLKRHRQQKDDDIEKQKLALKGIVDFLTGVAGLRIHKGTVRDFFSIGVDRVTISVDSVAKPLVFYSTRTYPNSYQITNGKRTVTEEEIMDILLRHHVVIP